ncbi:ATP-binding cassette domain-containing protein [Terrimonas pollutisoli]|uniref:ATP-binding cassette domain-containing protein n=1 Tax=Terrimonas pollutisoli TaxID=3034147 RepID=UPI0023EB0679|nr:ABC transporter ATP-binding protein [Terrimonas sp. H1YJ31]
MIRILKNTWRVLSQKEKKHFNILIMLDIFISILDIASLALLLWIIQFYIQPGNNLQSAFLPAWLTNNDSAWPVALFCIFFAVKNAAAFFISKAYYKFNSDVAIRISYNNLSGYQQSNYDDFVNIDSSKHIRNICFQPFEFCQYILTGIQQIITQSSLIIITVVAILILNAKLFLLLLLILLPPVIIVFYWIKKRMNLARQNIRIHNQQSYRYLMDALKGWVESNIYNRHGFFLNRFIQSRKQFSNALFDSLALQNMPPRVIEVFAVLGLFVLILIAKSSAAVESFLLTIGAFMAAAYKIIPGIVKITNLSGQMKAFEFSASDLINKNKPQPKDDAAISGIRSMQLKDIYFSYNGHPVLDNFNLTIQPGDFIGITGVSGKGKTTVLNILLGFVETAKGELTINNSPIKNGEIKKAWPSIAYVRQQTFLIHDTLSRNITLEEEAVSKSTLESAIKIAGLTELISQSPEGCDKMITENGKNISGGQQQRIAIARALYKTADMILLDEPFNELDENAETALLQHCRMLTQQGKMIVLITHNKKSLAYCTKIISLDGGE